jgi:hypothetical protein
MESGRYIKWTKYHNIYDEQHTILIINANIIMINDDNDILTSKYQMVVKGYDHTLIMTANGMVVMLLCWCNMLVGIYESYTR